ncbi:hypothetical protein V8C35DRAFT_279104 [Trichoderma chlorosporum]
MDKPATLSRRGLPKTTMIYIIVGVVVGVTCTVGVIAFLVIKHRKGQKYSQLRKRTPAATTNNRESYRKSIMSTVSEVDDAQRQAMIRKSLATRSSMMTLNMDAGSVYTAPHPLDRTASHFLYRPVSHPLEEAITETAVESAAEEAITETAVEIAAETVAEAPEAQEPQEPQPPPSRDEESLLGLKEDWKEWEARLHQNRSLSLDYHPAVAPERKDSTGSNGATGEYRLDAGPPSQAHLGLATTEFDRRSVPPMSRPNSVVSLKSTRSLPMKYEVKRDPRSPHQLHHSWTAS